jgi:S-ribosylhomocysteine lyase LuxS involved in autoinducer biosynthesis
LLTVLRRLIAIILTSDAGVMTGFYLVMVLMAMNPLVVNAIDAKLMMFAV